MKPYHHRQVPNHAIVGSMLILVASACVAESAYAACSSQDVELKDLVAVKSPEDLDCYLNRKRLDPDNRLWAQESYRLAKQTAVWVTKILTDSDNPERGDIAKMAAQFPVAFAFYPDDRYKYGTCEKNTASKYLKKGGAGEPLCNLMEESSALGSGSLADLTVQLMEVGRQQFVNSDLDEDAKQIAINGIFAQVRELGFNPYYRFTQEYNTNLDYNPKVDKFGDMIPVSATDTEYAGLSGGGGSGSGFGLYCLKDDGSQMTVLEAGGGGGAGATSPGGDGTPLEAGGGGSAGLRVTNWVWTDAPTTANPKRKTNHAADVPLIETFAFSDLNWSFGAIWDNRDLDKLSELPTQVQNAITSLRNCQTNQWPIQIRGGGGGGEGFEFLKPSGGQDTLLALNLGYGFQFAIGLDGQGNPLTLYRHPAKSLTPKQVIVCPFTRETGVGPLKESVVDWKKCLSDNPPPATVIGNSQPEPTTLYSCIGSIVPKLCKTATYADNGKNKSYTAYGNYSSCNGPVTSLYKEEYGTLWDKIYEPKPKGPSTAPPTITADAIKAHKEWCPDPSKLPEGCAPLKECQSSP